MTIKIETQCIFSWCGHVKPANPDIFSSIFTVLKNTSLS